MDLCSDHPGGSQPPEVIGKDSAEHYTWGAACDGWHLVKGPALSIIHERMPPETSEKWHYHRQACQFFFVLSGTAIIDVDGNEKVLLPQQGLQIMPGLPHQIFNRSESPVEFLVISMPSTKGDRVDEE